jgi:adenylate kinase
MTHSKEDLQIILLFGPPGSGKGTQADLLAAKFGFLHLDSSKALEEWFRNVQDEEYVEVEGKKYYALEERKLWEGGVLMSPPVVAYIMQEKIKQLHQSGKDIVTSGSLRTLYEAEYLYPIIEELYGKENLSIFSLKIDADQSIYRNSHRRICELMRHSIISSEETKNLTICPIDGSKLLQREGLDDAETIKVRLKEYAERTEPVFEYLQESGLVIKQVDGDRSVAEVFKDIQNDLN